MTGSDIDLTARAMSAIHDELIYLTEVSQSIETVVARHISHAELSLAESNAIQRLDRLTQGLADLSHLTNVIMKNATFAKGDLDSLSAGLKLGEIRERLTGITYQSSRGSGGDIDLF